jgi:mannose-6-phosphate isomerase-like protein (cupin superfamily)
MEMHAMENAVEPDPIIKPFLMAVINYSERIKNGEPVTEPPLLTANSSPVDYAAWLNRSDMVSPGTDEVYAKIIGYTDKVTTAIVWLRDYAPQEVHDDEYERFLIVEGSCDIVVDDEVNKLVPGDFFEIPLYKKHFVKVTSPAPCKIILQRVAA